MVNQLRERMLSLKPHLDERQWRLYMACEARAIGLPGGVAEVAKAVGSSRATIYRGLKEFETGDILLPRTRRSGAGRPRVQDTMPDLVSDLEKLVDPATRGDPESALRWTSKSTQKLTEALRQQGYDVSARTVYSLLQAMGFSMQANVKTREGSDHPDRNAQFEHINLEVKRHQQLGHPVISIDCKKKELVGNFKNPGQEWARKGEPVEVNMHDFPDPELGKAIPYGIYDVTRNEGFVNVGCDRETSAFAVESIRRWWRTMGKEVYPDANEIYLCADGGGSNGYRRRQWKAELARWAQEDCLSIHVSHLPPGTSKWNKIEHRMFSHISMNWRGRPLTSHEVIIQLIGSTTTSTGLRIQAGLDDSKYPKVTITDEDMESLAGQISRNEFHGEWNYSIRPISSS